MGTRKPLHRPSDRELRAYAREHLVYDLSMLVRAIPVLDEVSVADIATDSEEWFKRNAFVEANAIRLRSLSHFLFRGRTPQSHRDDVFAQDYNRSWSRKPPTDLDKLADQASKSVAHVSRARLDMKDIAWPYKHAAKKLGDAFADFLKGISPGTMDDDTVRELEKLLQELMSQPQPRVPRHEVATTASTTIMSVEPLPAWRLPAPDK